MWNKRHVAILLYFVLLSSVIVNIYLCSRVIQLRASAVLSEKHKSSVNNVLVICLSSAALSLENIKQNETNDCISAEEREYDKTEVIKYHYQLIGALRIELENGGKVDTLIKQLNGIINTYLSSSSGEQIIRDNSKEIAERYRSILQYECDFYSKEVESAILDLDSLLRSFHDSGVKVDVISN